MSQEDADAVLDRIEQELDHAAGQQGHEEIEAEEELVVDDIEPETGEEIEKPSGFITYEDWIAQGKDPKKFRGEEAFEAHGKTLNEVKELKQMLQAVMESTEEWKVSQRRQEEERVNAAREEALKALERAKEEEDVEGALAAKDRLTELESVAPKEAEANKPSPGITEFIKKHPVLDSAKAEYDPDFYNDMAQFQQTILEQMTGKDPHRIAQLTPKQIGRTMSAAYEQAKLLYPEKFKSKRNGRQSAPPPPQQRRMAPTPSPKDKLKGMGRNPRNARDTNPALGMYEMLKDLDPEIAENFVKRITQE